jgi:hypothetical protein
MPVAETVIVRSVTLSSAFADDVTAVTANVIAATTVTKLPAQRPFKIGMASSSTLRSWLKSQQ